MIVKIPQRPIEQLVITNDMCDTFLDFYQWYQKIKDETIKLHMEQVVARTFKLVQWLPFKFYISTVEHTDWHKKEVIVEFWLVEEDKEDNE